MRRTLRRALILLPIALPSLVAPSIAQAQVAEPERARWLVFAHSGGDLYQSQARTQGGLGGGLGLRLHWGDYWVAEGSFTVLAGTGRVHVFRLGAGLERQGWYCPAILIGPALFGGDSLRFLTEQHPMTASGPAATLALTLVPVRFRTRQAELTLASVSVGIGADFPGLGWSIGLTAVEIASGI